MRMRAGGRRCCLCARALHSTARLAPSIPESSHIGQRCRTWKSRRTFATSFRKKSHAQEPRGCPELHAYRASCPAAAPDQDGPAAAPQRAAAAALPAGGRPRVLEACRRSIRAREEGDREAGAQGETQVDERRPAGARGEELPAVVPVHLRAAARLRQVARGRGAPVDAGQHARQRCASTGAALYSCRLPCRHASERGCCWRQGGCATTTASSTARRPGSSPTSSSRCVTGRPTCCSTWSSSAATSTGTPR